MPTLFFSTCLLKLASLLPDLLLINLSVFSLALGILILFLFLLGRVAYVSKALLSALIVILSGLEILDDSPRPL